jgi:endogenous inhibitor of DNA gyrase (YacG/DUF329 family)
MSAKITPLQTQKLKFTNCPVCGENTTSPHTPFCSRRCSQLDLGKWLNEAYVIPVLEGDKDMDLDTLTAQADKDIPSS